MKKKLFSILLTLTMIFSLIPGTAFAVDAGETVTYSLDGDNPDPYTRINLVDGDETVRETNGVFGIAKYAEGEPLSADDRFTFDIMITDGTGIAFNGTLTFYNDNGDTQDITFTNGQGSISIGFYESWWVGLPTGFTYMVEEQPCDNYDLIEAYDNSGTIDAGGRSLAMFYNIATRPGDDFGKIKVRKEVTEGSPDDRFSFKIRFTGDRVGDLEGFLWGYNDTEEFEFPVDDNGEVSFTLADREEITFDLPSGIHYEIVEEEYEGYENISKSNESGTVGSGNTTTSVFVNRKNNGDDDGRLKVKKVLKDIEEPDPDTKFVIKVTVTDPDGYPVTGEREVVINDAYEEYVNFGEDGSAEIEIAGGEDFWVMIPGGCTYTVEEVKIPDGYELDKIDGGKGTITPGKDFEVTVTNKDEEHKDHNGKLIVEKTVSGTMPSEDDEFTILVKIADDKGELFNNLWFNYYDKNGEPLEDTEIINGEAYLKLKNGEHAELELPIGASYEVEEIDMPSAYQNVEIVNEKGTIIDGKTVRATVKNKVIKKDNPPAEGKGTLTISKTVNGNKPRKTGYDFTLSFKGANGKPLTGDFECSGKDGLTSVSNGETITLDADDEITIVLPAGTEAMVTEADYGPYYTTTVNGKAGNQFTATIVNGEDEAAAYTNTRVESITGHTDGKGTPVAALNIVDHYGYIVGRPDGKVYAETQITRAEVATIFYRLLTEDSRKALWIKSNNFSDLQPSDWYNTAISVMCKGDVVHGYPDGTFRPNNSITRAEFATIAAYFLSNDYTGKNLYNDINGHWAAKYINRAAQAGWIHGYPDGTFRPNNYITRAEAVTLVNAVLNRLPDKDHFINGMITWPDNTKDKWYYAQVQEATNSHEYEMEGAIEAWTKALGIRDWAAIEREWSNIYTSVNPGEVMK